MYIKKNNKPKNFYYKKKKPTNYIKKITKFLFQKKKDYKY
jgi:hypothetical protein